MRRAPKTGIAVIEGRWWPHTNISARSLFDLVAELGCGNPHAYHYEMANSEPALKEAIPRIGRQKGLKYLCIANHGDQKSIATLDGKGLSRTELRNLLVAVKSTKGSRIAGLHLSACLVGSREMAEFLFAREIGIKWFAGYAEEVNWIESSALDLLFFNKLVSTSGFTQKDKIEDVAKHLMAVAPGLVKHLGFGIFTRKSGTGGIRNLCEG